MVVALWGFFVEGKHGWAWFACGVVAFGFMVGAVTGKVLPYLATLDYSRLGLMLASSFCELGGLLVVSLVPVVGMFMSFRWCSRDIAFCAGGDFGF